MIARGDVFLSVLLTIAVSVFVWRIVHYAKQYRSMAAAAAPIPPASEIRRIRQYTPVLAALLVLKSWLITLMWSAGEIAFAVVLVGAVLVLAIRLGLYARRWAQLQRGGPTQSQ